VTINVVSSSFFVFSLAALPFSSDDREVSSSSDELSELEPSELPLFESGTIF
jgi:hypothetical protein